MTETGSLTLDSAFPVRVGEELCRMLPVWLPGRRWYAGKGHTPPSLDPVLTQVVVPGPPTLLQVVVRTDEGEFYQLLVGARPTAGLPSSAVPPDAVIGTSGMLTLYEAGGDQELLTRYLDRFTVAEPCGEIEFHRLPGADIVSGLRARPLSAEQSNTSVAYGNSLMLKVLRRIVPGTNPELELLQALARAGSVPSAAPLGWATAAGSTLCLLQELVPSRGDGWVLATKAAEDCVRGACASVAPQGGFTQEAFSLGRATAQVHAALAEQLGSRPLTPAEATELTDTLMGRLGEAAAEVPDITPYARELRTAYQDLREVVHRGHPLTIQRVHGDLHLGQALRADAGWVLIDFEGEPGHPLEERRRLQPPVRDVAGMLRSFDYAAHHALGEIVGAPPRSGAPGDPRGTRLARRAAAWAVHCRRAFCAGYAAAGGQDPRTSPVLLRAFEADKAIYEAVYEARNRPQWLPTPLAAVRRLARGHRFVG